MGTLRESVDERDPFLSGFFCRDFPEKIGVLIDDLTHHVVIRRPTNEAGHGEVVDHVPFNEFKARSVREAVEYYDRG